MLMRILRQDGCKLVLATTSLMTMELLRGGKAPRDLVLLERHFKGIWITEATFEPTTRREVSLYKVVK